MLAVQHSIDEDGSALMYTPKGLWHISDPTSLRDEIVVGERTQLGYVLAEFVGWRTAAGVIKRLWPMPVAPPARGRVREIARESAWRLCTDCDVQWRASETETCWSCGRPGSPLDAS